MKKAFLLMMALLMIAAMVPAAGAQGDPALAAVDYVLSQQNEDGSWLEGEPVDQIIGTSLVLMALGTVDQSNEAGLMWLETAVAEHMDDLTMDNLSGVILAVVAQGGDPTMFADADLVGALNGELRMARGEDIGGLCVAMVALYAAGEDIHPMALRGLTGLQNEDGGFGMSSSSEASDLLVTTICIQALAAAGDEEALTSALDYLAAQQNEDGGWGIIETGISDAGATVYGVMALLAADQDLTAWGNPETVLYAFQDQETGAIPLAPAIADDPVTTLMVTGLSTMVFRGQSFISFAPVADDMAEMPAEEETGADDAGAMAEGEGPALDAQWQAVAGGFNMTELNTADDFFVTVVDPFTDNELYGIEILNWVADYQHTGYIVESYLPAEVLIWMAEQDPSTWQNISPSLLEKLPEAEFEKLPEDVQAMLDS